MTAEELKKVILAQCDEKKCNGGCEACIFYGHLNCSEEALKMAVGSLDDEPVDINAAFRVIIAGGRDFDDYLLLCKTMDKLLVNVTERIIIISGTARGADSLGERYAAEKGYEVRRFPADWEKYGKSAGYRRNERMAEYADALVAFWDGESRGTANMISLAEKRGLKVRVKRY